MLQGAKTDIFNERLHMTQLLERKLRNNWISAWTVKYIWKMSCEKSYKNVYSPTSEKLAILLVSCFVKLLVNQHMEYELLYIF